MIEQNNGAPKSCKQNLKIQVLINRFIHVISLHFDMKQLLPFFRITGGCEVDIGGGGVVI